MPDQRATVFTFDRQFKRTERKSDQKVYLGPENLRIMLDQILRDLTLSAIRRLNGNVGRENPEPLSGFPGLPQNHGP